MSMHSMQALIRHCRVLQHHCSTQLCRTVVRHASSGRRPAHVTDAAAAASMRKQGPLLAAAGSPASQQEQQQQQYALEPQPAGSFQVSIRELAGKGKVRLDAYLAAQLPEASRAKITASIKAGLVLVNGAAVTKPAQAVRGGDRIAVSLLPPEPCTAIPEPIPLDVVYEDEHLIVVNKAAGMVVHLSPGHSTGTLVNALLAHCGLPPCTVACGSDPAAAGAAGAAAAAGQGLLSAASASTAVGDVPLSILGGMLEDELAEGEDDDDELGSSSSSDDEVAASNSNSSSSTAGINTRSSNSSRGILRPGIVHRLDRGTSGLMVVAKTDFCHAALCSQFKERSVSRIYNAIVAGVPSPAAAHVATNITRDLGNRLRMMAVPYGSGRGRTAASNYQTLQQLAGGGAALVQWKLETGRTHQIRVHARHIGHALLGDDLYGPGHAAAARTVIGKRSSLLAAARAAVEGFGRPALHAKTLGFTHPVTGQRLEFDSQWPQDFQQLHQQLQAWQ